MTYNSSQTPATSSFLDALVEIFPPLEGDEFAALVADIRKHGLREAITRYQGKVIDGHNRERACAAAGVTPRYENFEGAEAEAVAFVISKNVLRRHLTQ
jgi:ParB-like chromosome segregation protein Spo0J